MRLERTVVSTVLLGIFLFIFMALCLFLSACDRYGNRDPLAPDEGEPALDLNESPPAILNLAKDKAAKAKDKKDISLYREAMALTKLAVRKDPNFVDGYLTLARLNFEYTDFTWDNAERDRRFHLAKKLVEMAMAIGKPQPVFYYELARIHTALNDYRASERYLLTAIELDPSDYYAKVDLGINYYNLKEYERAEEVLTDCQRNINKDQDTIAFIRTTEFLGRTLIKLGKLDLAEETLKRSVGQYDEWIDEHGNQNYWGCPYQALGELYSETGHKDKENEYFIKAAEMEIYRPWMQWEGALRDFQNGNYQGSMEFLTRLFTLEDNDDYRMLEGFILLSFREYDKAKALFEKTSHSCSSVGLGHLDLIRQDYAAAEKHFSGYLSDPGTVMNVLSLGRKTPSEMDDWLYREIDSVCYEMACLGMGWLNSNQDRHAAAIEYYNKILAFHPQSLLALVGKGNALSGLARLDEAQAAFEQALAYYPDNKYAITELGIVKYNKGDLESAEADFRTALEKDDQTYTCPYEGMGLVYLRRGATEKAEEYFQKAIAINPDIEYKKYNGLARIYLKEGKIDEAEKLLKKSKANYPYDGEADELLKKIAEMRANQSKPAP